MSERMTKADRRRLLAEAREPGRTVAREPGRTVEQVLNVAVLLYNHANAMDEALAKAEAERERAEIAWDRLENEVKTLRIVRDALMEALDKRPGLDRLEEEVETLRAQVEACERAAKGEGG